MKNLGEHCTAAARFLRYWTHNSYCSQIDPTVWVHFTGFHPLVWSLHTTLCKYRSWVIRFFNKALHKWFLVVILQHNQGGAQEGAGYTLLSLYTTVHRFKCRRRCSNYRNVLRQACSKMTVQMYIQMYIQVNFVHCASRGQAALATKKPRQPCTKALSLTPFVYRQAILEIAVTRVKCSVSSQWVEGLERRGRTMVTQKRTTHKHLDTIEPASFQAVQPPYP